jgi:uncharacterized protein YceK
MKHLLPAGLLLMMTGCGTIVGWADPPSLQLQSATDTDDQRYIGPRIDAKFLCRAWDNTNSGVASTVWLGATGLIGGLDLCASVVADTLLLPVALLIRD